MANEKKRKAVKFGCIKCLTAVPTLLLSLFCFCAQRLRGQTIRDRYGIDGGDQGDGVVVVVVMMMVVVTEELMRRLVHGGTSTSTQCNSSAYCAKLK